MKSTLGAKLVEGLASQGWQVRGFGGTWSSALRPLEAYVNRKIERAVKAEREACAKVCDEMEKRAEGTECCKWPTPSDCAAAIRGQG